MRKMDWKLLIPMLSLLMTFSTLLFSQTPAGQDAQSPAVEGLAHRGADAADAGSVESVDPRYGTLSLNIPLLHLPGRNGLNLDLAASYASSITDYRMYRYRTGTRAGEADEGDPRNGILEDHLAARTEYGEATAGLGLGWAIPVGVTVFYITRLDGGTTFEDINPPYPAAAISGHSYYSFFSPCACGLSTPATCQCRNILGGTSAEYLPLFYENSYWTAEGHLRYVGAGDSGAFVVDKSGTKYYLTYGAEQSFKTRLIKGMDGSGRPQYHDIGFKFKVGVTTKIQDANGNYITIQYGDGGLIDTITDTLGRTVTFRHERSPRTFNQHRYTQIEYTDSEGNPQVFRFFYETKTFGPGMRKATGGTDHFKPWNDFRRSRAVLERIQLPNRKEWVFEYDTSAASRTWDGRVLNLGQMSKLVYPTGGYTTFEYTDQPYATIESIIRDGGCSHGPDNIKIELRRLTRHPNGDGLPITADYAADAVNSPMYTVGPCGGRTPAINHLWVENKGIVEEKFSGGGKVRHYYFALRCPGSECRWEPSEPIHISYGMRSWGADYRVGTAGQDALDVNGRIIQQTRIRYFTELLAEHNDGARIMNEYNPAAHGGLRKLVLGTPFIINQKTFVGASEVPKVSEIRYADEPLRWDGGGRDRELINAVLAAQAWPGNRKQAKYFDFGDGRPGPLIRTETFEYEPGPEYQDPAVNLRALVKRHTVYKGDPADGLKMAETEFTHDQYAGETALVDIDAGGLPGHDPSVHRDYAPRGNVTHVAHWLNTAGAPVVTQQQFDIAGNVRASFDARHHRTQWDYRETTRFAYPEVVRNALNQEARKQYILHKGLVQSEADPNQDINDPQRRSEYVYNDPLDRLKTAQRPFGSGRRDITYLDDQLKIREATRLNSTLSAETETQLDSLGRVRRVKHAQAPEDPGDVAVDTLYDDEGRVFAVSNPYFEGGETDGWTRTCYDGAGRPIEVETFSGPAEPPPCGRYEEARTTGRVTSEYVDNAVLVTDQAGNQRISVKDALGQLIEVFEVDPEADGGDRDETTWAGRTLYGYRTRYEYDPLGNLILVCQGGTVVDGDCSPGAQRRRFEYDSLSRLRRSENPESGAVTYAYDDQGNLTEKTDARGLTTHYEYDDLDRPQIKYVTGAPEDGYQTPEVVYFYDQTGEGGVLVQRTRQGLRTLSLPEGFFPKNTIGRLVATKVGDDIAEFFSYDIHGQLIQHSQRIKGVDFRVAYDYDGVGNIIGITYPSGMAVQYTINKANHVTAVANAEDSPVLPAQNWVTNIRYRAHGGKDEWTFGNGLREKIEYNSRIQPEKITTVDPDLRARDTRLLEFSLGYGPAARNNGNIRGIAELVWDPETQSLLGQFKQFDYDALNRLRAAQADAGPRPWSLRYQYDRYGNRLRQVRLAGDEARVPEVIMAMESQGGRATNRMATLTINGQFKTPAYDPAGNLTSDGDRRFYFDAENQIYKVNDGEAEYRYNASNRRVYKKVGACETRFIYGASGHLLAEINNGECP